MPDNNPACTIVTDDGIHYDLSKLSSTKDYTAESGEGSPKYMFNVCRGVVTELANVEDPGSVGGFVERPDGRGHFSLGQFTTNVTISPGTRDPMLVYEKGSPCPSNDKEFASTAIRFVCSPQDFGSGTPRLVASLPPGPDACHFFFEWKTHVACPASQKAAFDGSILVPFVAFVLIAILTWFGGHTAYNRFYLGRRGMDQFPIHCGSCTRPKLRLPGVGSGDGSASRGPRRWGFRRSQRGAGYNHLPTEPDEEDSLTAARFSLTDDEEDIDHDARALGGEVDAWRGHGVRNPRDSGEGRVGAHQGLVDL